MFEITTALGKKPVSKEERLYTIEEYLEMEEFSQINHEYHNGKLIPMAGGTPAHSEVKAQLIISLGIAIRASKQPCRIYNSDIRINLPEIGRVLMPDATVVAGKPDFTIEKPIGLLANPTLIIEVFSKSSEGYDRGDKFKQYRTLSSFTEYMLVSQEKPAVETFVKKDGQWFINEVAEGLEASVVLDSIGITLSLSDIYWGVGFEEKKPKKAASKKSS
jgi:Uma2 family endonuclease